MAWLQAFGILTCAPMLMHAIVHGGGGGGGDCRDTTRESAMGVDSRREIHCHTGDPNQCPYCAWLFGQMLYQLSYPGPTPFFSSFFSMYIMSVLFCQFNSIFKKTAIIPQEAIFFWSWRARKIIHKVKRTKQQTQHHQQKSLTLTIVSSALWAAG